MFHIKICGIRFKTDIDAVADSQADAVGLNFFSPSIRYVDPAAPSTRELSLAAQTAGLIRVGVFVNESVSRIRSIADQVGLDVIQLHGDETVDQVAGLGGPRVRAIKLPTGPLSIDKIAAKVDPWVAAGFAVLLDADAGAMHGGSGKTLDWPSIAAWAKSNPQVTWTLAGGLNPDNVADAIACTGAISVDTASGVESPKGQKSAELITRFAARCQTN